MRVGVAGAGYFARYQISAWQRIESAELCGVAEIDEVRRGEVMELFPHVSVFESVDQMLEAVQLDVLDVATPPATHSTVVSSVFGRVPLIVCQKPFCTGSSEAKALVEQSEGSGSHIVIHENFRFQRWYREIARIIESGRLGQILEARFNLRPGDGQGEHAYLARQPYFRDMPKFLIRETGIHFVDVFRFLFGEPDTVLADLRRCNPAIKGEDSGAFTFGYGSGLRAHFNGNRLLDSVGKNPRLTMGTMLIEGTKGQLSLSGDGDLRFRAFGSDKREAIDYAFDDRDFGGDCVFHLQSHVAANYREPDQIENKAVDYLQNLKIEDAIYESDRTGMRIKLEEKS